MVKFVCCVGLPGSGKSRYCEDYLTEYYDAKWLSSDQLRIELLGDENDQTHNKEVFAELNKRAFVSLAGGVNVVYDATNLNRKRRTELLKGLPPCEKICYWFDTPIDKCIQRDSKREHQVGEKVIRKMNCQLEVPTYDEGWDRVIRLVEEEKNV